MGAPLRERKGDIPKLARSVIDELNHSYEHKKTITPAAEALLLQYPWPGNVRELRNVMERAFIISDGEQIQPQDLAILDGGSNTPQGFTPMEQVAPQEGGPALTGEPLQVQVDRFEAGLMAQAMAKAPSLRAAARLVQMDPATFLRRKKKFQDQGLLPPD